MNTPSNSTDWVIQRDGSVILAPTDPRLEVFADFLHLVSRPLGTPLTVTGVSTDKSPDGSLLRISGTVDAWDSSQTTLEVSLVAQTGLGTRVTLRKPVDVFEHLTLPILKISDFRQHASCETRNPDGTGFAIHTGGYSGKVLLGSRGFLFDLTACGAVFYDFVADFTDTAQTGRAPGLLDLAELLGLKDPHEDLQFLPSDLQSADLISLERLELRIEPDDPRKLAFVSVGLSFLSGKVWQAIPGLPWLKVGNLKAVLEVEHPLDSDYRFPRIHLSGTVELGSSAQQAKPSHIDLQVRWPDLAIQGELRKQDTIALAALLSEMGIPSGGLPQKLAITDLGFRAEPDMEKKRFEFHGAVQNAWEIDLPDGKSLSIERLAFHLDYQQGESPTMKPQLEGVVGLGGLTIGLSAEREMDGWRFAGNNGSGQELSIGEWIEELAKVFKGVSVPPVVAGAKLLNVDVSFNTGTKDFHFSIEAKLPVSEGSDTTELDIVLTLDLVHHGEAFEKKFAGHVNIGSRKFDLNFAQSSDTKDGDSTGLVASYQNDLGETITLREILTAAGVNADDVPDLSVSLKSALFALEKNGGDQESWKVFGLNIDAGMDLTGLPLIGKVVPAGQSLSLQLQAMYSSLEIKSEEGSKRVAPVNALLPSGSTPLPAQGKAGEVIIAKGPGLAATLHLGSVTIPLSLPLRMKQDGNIQEHTPRGKKADPPGDKTTSPSAVVPATRSSDTPVAITDDLKWFTVQKSFGPAHLERIGAGYANGEISLAVDASVSLSSLTLTLDGLGVTSPIKEFAPQFRLRGIGLDCSNGGVEIDGSFLRLAEDSYAGSAVIRAKTLTLSAIGAYQKINDHTSVFIYAVLEYPLGGPSFCFINGLAAGFGYNRSLLMPEIGALREFPLIQKAVPGAKQPSSLTDEFSSLEQFIPPDLGQYFLAIGVKFNSFKLIDSFALLAVSFGHRFEIDVLGLSTLVVPTPVPGAAPVAPLARVSIALMARFVPDEGLLAVSAQITSDSFILSPECHISGGFAFYTWFAGPHSGDFVMSLGGYHPRFNVPAHYPLVPRVAFNWQVVPEKLVIKGDAYYALTSHSLMAGGHLEASYHSGALQAWFKVGADFLICWQPYHYDAHAYIEIGGSYDTGIGTISVDLSADLHIFGPEFAGTAEVDLTICTVHVAFGSQQPPPSQFISWEAFTTAFLPSKAADVLSIAVEAGLNPGGNKAQDDPQDGVLHLGTVNPFELRIVTNSLIPLSTWQVATASSKGPIEAHTKPGIAPVNIALGAVQISHVIAITRDGVDISEDFSVVPVLKDMPAALWGAPTGGVAQANPGERFLRDATTGLRLKPLAPPPPLHTNPVLEETVERHAEASSVVVNGPTFIMQPEPARAGSDATDAPVARRQMISDSILQSRVVEARNARLASLGIDPAEVRLGGFSGLMLNADPAFTRHPPLQPVITA